ncbi:hypothetical protein EMCRGX_G023441 [Ephydatia muelleri]
MNKVIPSGEQTQQSLKRNEPPNAKSVEQSGEPETKQTAELEKYQVEPEKKWEEPGIGVLGTLGVGIFGAGKLGAGRIGAGRLGVGTLGAGRLGAGRLGVVTLGAGVGTLGAGTLGAGRLGVGTLGVGTIGVNRLGVSTLGVGTLDIGSPVGILGHDETLGIGVGMLDVATLVSASNVDDGLLVGQVAKKGSSRRQVSVLSSWMEAWNILHSDCAQTTLELVKYQHIICQLFAPDGSSLEPVPSRLTTTPAGTTPPSGAHRASHLNAGQEICQCFNFGRLWWRALRQGLAMCYTSGPVISSKFIPLYDHKLTPLYDQRAHTTLQPVSSDHSTTSELTPLYNQRAHTTLRPVSSHHSTTSELTPLYDQRTHTTL